jgi:iron complex outermembrane receptor protein
MNRTVCLILLSALIAPVSGFPRSSDSPPAPEIRETVVVSASLAPAELGQATREVVVIPGDVMRRWPVQRVTDVLALAAVVDLRPSVAGGLFGDIYLRAASSAGVLVCVDGMRWNDPQTAHFNMEIPVPLELVERVEILTGASSVFFGADAVGGVVNIITRRTAPDGARLAVSGGSFGTAGGAVTASAGLGSGHALVYGGLSRSDGFMPNRDYRLGQVWAGFTQPHSLGSAEISYGHLDSAFGAQGFYGPYPSYEHTRSHGLVWRNSLSAGFFRRRPTRVDLSWRRHDDDYILVRDHPELYRNRHENQTVQLLVHSLAADTPHFLCAAGFELRRDALASARLGDHSTGQAAGMVEFQWLPDTRTVLQGTLRVDHFSRYGTVWTPGLGLAWRPAERWKLRAFAGKAFRAPSFTELYYWSPSNQGNPALLPERAATLEGGADWFGAAGSQVSGTAFVRWDREMVDWIRVGPLEPWRAANIGRAAVAGGSIHAARPLAAGLRLQGGYALNGLALGQPVDFESKYVLDYCRHHLAAQLTGAWGAATTWSVSVHHKVRAGVDRRYTLLAARAARRWRNLEFHVRAENLLNESYEEVLGVPMPGRAVYGGVSVDLTAGAR